MHVMNIIKIILYNFDVHQILRNNYVNNIAMMIQYIQHNVGKHRRRSDFSCLLVIESIIKKYIKQKLNKANICSFYFKTNILWYFYMSMNTRYTYKIYKCIKKYDKSPVG